MRVCVCALRVYEVRVQRLLVLRRPSTTHVCVFVESGSDTLCWRRRYAKLCLVRIARSSLFLPCRRGLVWKSRSTTTLARPSAHHQDQGCRLAPSAGRVLFPSDSLAGESASNQGRASGEFQGAVHCTPRTYSTALRSTAHQGIRRSWDRRRRGGRCCCWWLLGWDGCAAGRETRAREKDGLAGWFSEHRTISLQPGTRMTMPS